MNFQYGRLPWEKFSTDIPVGERNIIKRCGLEWRIEKYPLIATAMARAIKIPDTFAMVREPDSAFISTCKSWYEPAQNIDVVTFFAKYSNLLKLKLQWAGHLGDKTWVYAVAKTPYGFSIGGKDAVEAYLLFTHSHQVNKGTWPMVLLHRPINGTTYVERVPNTAGFDVRPTEEWNAIFEKKAQELLVNFKLKVSSLEQRFTKLADVRVEETIARHYFMRNHFTDLRMARSVKIPGAVLQSADIFLRGHGAQLISSCGTWWGAYQAYCYYLDYIAGSGTEDYKFFSSFIGPRAMKKRKALDFAWAEVKDS